MCTHPEHLESLRGAQVLEVHVLDIVSSSCHGSLCCIDLGGFYITCHNTMKGTVKGTCGTLEDCTKQPNVHLEMTPAPLERTAGGHDGRCHKAVD